MNYIVVPHYIINQKLLDLAVNALKSLKLPGYKIISIDDGSPLAGAKDKIVELSDFTIVEKSNAGFAHAVNGALKMILDIAEDDSYIICANNDIEVYPGWEQAMREPFEDWNNVAVTGLTSRRVKFYDGKHISKHSDDKITEGGRLGEFMQQGGLWMSKKSVIEKVGLFDQQFSGGGMEDVDLFLRMRDTYGMKIIMSGKSVFWHAEGSTRFKVSKEMEEKYRAIQLENEQRFKKKWGFDYMTTPNLWHENVL